MKLKDVVSLESIEHSAKPVTGVKLWFRSLANSLFTASKTVLAPKSTSRTVESADYGLTKCMKQAKLLNYLLCLRNSYTHKTRTKPKLEIFDSDSEIIANSDSEFELSPEKVKSFQKVEESDAKSCLPSPLYQNMKCKIITGFLTRNGSQK